MLEFRVAVRGIRPVIWRHVAVLGTTSLAELHRVLQAVCEWGDKHPYVFAIGGQSFGSFADGPIQDARGVTLADLNLGVGETFAYGYRLRDSWELDLRVLGLREIEPGEVLPVLMDGKRSAPDEDLSGVKAYLTRRGGLESNPPRASFKIAADAVMFVAKHNTRPDPKTMQELANAQAEIDEYIRFTSPALEIEAINRRLRELRVSP